MDVDDSLRPSRPLLDVYRAECERSVQKLSCRKLLSLLVFWNHNFDVRFCACNVWASIALRFRLFAGTKYSPVLEACCCGFDDRCLKEIEGADGCSNFNIGIEGPVSQVGNGRNKQHIIHHCTITIPIPPQVNPNITSYPSDRIPRPTLREVAAIKEGLVHGFVGI